MAPKIQVKNLYKSFGSHDVLKGIDLEVGTGRSLVILGGSGSGKSVLIKTIIGLIKPDNGEIFVDGKDVAHIGGKERRELLSKCGFLFQSGALFDSLTVQENIVFYAEKLNKLSLSEKKDLAEAKLNSVGLSGDILELHPAELSGGMQKRVSLARAICANPQIIFFDEPTTGLDPIMANVINDLIIKVRDELGATTVTITHDMHSALAIATEVAMLYKGKILWHGAKKEVENSKNPYLHQFINGLTEGPIEVNV
jgi:phospholipid/cholesterol/gamma-HCH transport system ATP-binding protein